MTTTPATTYAPPCATCSRPTHAYCPVCMKAACNHCLSGHQHPAGARVWQWVTWALVIAGAVALVTWQAWF